MLRACIDCSLETVRLPVGVVENLTEEEPLLLAILEMEVRRGARADGATDD